MDALVLIAKIFGTGVILFLSATLIYMFIGGMGGSEERAKFGRVLTTEETWRQLGMSPMRGCGLVLVGALVVTYVVVWVLLRWF